MPISTSFIKNVQFKVPHTIILPDTQVVGAQKKAGGTEWTRALPLFVSMKSVKSKKMLLFACQVLLLLCVHMHSRGKPIGLGVYISESAVGWPHTAPVTNT